MSAGGVAQIATKAAGAFLNAYGTYSAYKSKELASKHNQKLLDANERITQASFEQDIDRTKRAGERFLSTQRSVMAKSGTKLEGSNIDVMMDSIKEIELDIFSIEFNKMASRAATDDAIREQQAAENSAREGRFLATITSFISSVA